MHELAITEGIISAAVPEAEKHGAKRILKIHLKIGELSGVLPECIQYYFDIASRGTIAEKALLSDTFKTGRFPNSAHLYDDGSSITITDPLRNVEAMHEFIYGDKPPQPEATVKANAAPTAIPAANFEPLPQF